MRDISRLRNVAFSGLLYVLLALSGTTDSMAQIEATPIKSGEEALKGVKALRILVPQLTAVETTPGVTKEAVETQARKILQEKLPALKVDQKAITVLYINVNLADFQSRLGYHGNLGVELRRPGMIMVGKDFPDSQVQEYKITLATVWAESVIFTGEVFAPTAVRKALDGVLERFVEDFRKANP
ncbi:MAG TPA: hypothetical protein VJM10_06005 [Candidatus Methylomirabilis sp.]|nr:hypothetical protein [Candidatus Methylomirabilis sp.]